jgi:hypothetical protein
MAFRSSGTCYVKTVTAADCFTVRGACANATSGAPRTRGGAQLNWLIARRAARAPRRCTPAACELSCGECAPERMLQLDDQRRGFPTQALIIVN